MLTWEKRGFEVVAGSDEQPTPAEDKALPNMRRPAELAKQFGCSQRTLRSMARAIGAYRQFGKQMFLTDDDVRALIESARPKPPIPPREPSPLETLVAFRALSPESQFEVTQAFLAQRRRNNARKKAERLKKGEK